VTLVLAHHATNRYNVVEGLLFGGGFCLLAAVAMLMRTSVATGNGRPIPENPYAGVLEKAVGGIARGERKRAPIYLLCTKALPSSVLGFSLVQR
jgi:hypothetical protein